MNRLKFSVFLLILLTAFSCTNRDNKSSEDDKAAIRDLYRQASAACAKGDAAHYLSLFSDDVVVMASESPVINGKDELKPIIEGLFDMFELNLPYTLETIELFEDRAVVRSSFMYSMTPKEGGETTMKSGKELDILKQQADGSWKIYMECWNYD